MIPNNEAKVTETMNADLLALAALVNAEAIEIQCADQDRLRKGFAPAYGENFQWPNRDLLRRLLRERGMPVTE